MSIIHTVGYEGADIDGVVAALRAAGVERLADVRAVAVSRKRGLSKKALAARLHDEGIEYRHLVALGTPKSGRDAARAGRGALFRTIYAAHVATEEAQGALRDLAVLVRERPDVPSMLRARSCDLPPLHRRRGRGGETGFDVLNLFPDPVGGHVGHSSERRRLHPRQGASPA